MIAALAQPLPPVRALLWTAIACAAVAAYCLAYTALAGSTESLQGALLWALVMIAPWLVAFEAQKRANSWPGIAAIFATTYVTSMVLGVVLLGHPFGGFPFVRRLPVFLSLVGAVAIVRAFDRKATDRAPSPSLDPIAVDWVKASGNYVELYRNGRATVHRATITAVENQLRRHGFVRVHRSALVRRDRIAKIRTEDVILADGTSVKMGKRYRANLDA